MRLPERAAFRRREEPVPILPERIQEMELGIAAGGPVGFGHARGEGTVEEAIVLGIDP